MFAHGLNALQALALIALPIGVLAGLASLLAVFRHTARLAAAITILAAIVVFAAAFASLEDDAAFLCVAALALVLMASVALAKSARSTRSDTPTR